MAHYKCFTDMFHRACRQSVGKKIHDLFAPAEEIKPAAVPLTAATRTIGGQGRQCLQTCCAANFASTTSCTFGGLFWSLAKTCSFLASFCYTSGLFTPKVPHPWPRSTTLNCQQIFPVLSANASG